MFGPGKGVNPLPGNQGVGSNPTAGIASDPGKQAENRLFPGVFPFYPATLPGRQNAYYRHRSAHAGASSTPQNTPRKSTIANTFRDARFRYRDRPRRCVPAHETDADATTLIYFNILTGGGEVR
jgi:hypothetical protein